MRKMAVRIVDTYITDEELLTQSHDSAEPPSNASTLMAGLYTIFYIIVVLLLTYCHVSIHQLNSICNGIFGSTLDSRIMVYILNAKMRVILELFKLYKYKQAYFYSK